MPERRSVSFVGTVIACLFLALAAVLAEDVIVPERCVPVCQQVASGEMGWWTAFLVWGCYCQEQEQNVTKKVATCKPARMLVVR